MATLLSMPIHAPRIPSGGGACFSSASNISTATARKRRKPEAPVRRSPACSGCATRKVACKPSPNGLSCASCSLHDLPCSLTPEGASPVKIEEVAQVPPGFRRREGRTIVKLRKTVATDTALSTLNIGPTSPTSRLTALELGGSLSWSLIASAFEEGSISSAIPMSRMHVVKEDFRKKGLRLDGLDSENEILFSCYTAIGSRRSLHSAIIGSDDLPYLAAEPLGARRETASRTLADRAVNLLDAAPEILKSSSMRNLEVITLVKDMLLFVDPTNSHLARLVPILRDQTAGLHRIRDFEESTRTSFELFDARLSVRQGVPPRLSTHDIEQYCYFTEDEHNYALASLKTVDIDPLSSMHISGWILNVQMKVLRQIHLIEREAMSDPSKTIASFAQLFTYIDMCKRYIGARIYHPCSPRSRPAELPPAFLAPPITARSVRAWTPPSHWVGKLTRADYLGQVPDIFLADCALLKTAERVSAMKTGGRGLDEKAELRIVLERLEIRKTARFRFLEGLVCLGVCLEDMQLDEKPADAHWIARRLDSSFSLVPDWIDLAVRAATEHQAGAGELAEAGVGWEELNKILNGFDKASVVFASSAQQARDLRKALVIARQPPDEVAADVVAKALAELALPAVE